MYAGIPPKKQNKAEVQREIASKELVSERVELSRVCESGGSEQRTQ